MLFDVGFGVEIFLIVDLYSDDEVNEFFFLEDL